MAKCIKKYGITEKIEFYTTGISVVKKMRSNIRNVFLTTTISPCFLPKESRRVPDPLLPRNRSTPASLKYKMNGISGCKQKRLQTIHFCTTAIRQIRLLPRRLGSEALRLLQRSGLPYTGR